MPKNNKKKQQKDTKDPQKLKELGNKAFANKNFLEAIDLYSKAIEEKDDDHVFYSNRAAAYFEIEEFDKCISDCDRCIELNKTFAKAYYRKALALREKLDNLSAMEVIKQALEIEPENDLFINLMHDTKQEYEEDHSLPDDHPEKQRFDRLLKWLKEGGSQFDKLKIRFYSPDYRGVHAARDIKKGEIILLVPKHQIITLEMAIGSPIGRKMFEKGLRQRLISPKHSFLATFIMQERRKPETIWDPYIDILPKNFSNFPIFFTEEELEWLKGSPFLDQIHEKIEDIKQDYDLICKEVPDYAQFPIREYSEIRMMVSSRIFGIQVEGVKTDGFVAYADMLNHKRPRQTTWTYTDEKQGFIIEAMEDIKRGEQVYDSYGKKCNSRFFLNYGFINLNNDANEVPIKVYYNTDDQYITVKKEMINDPADFKKFRVVENLEEKVMHEFISWLRFVEFDENIALIYQYKGAAVAQAQRQKKYREDSDSEEEEDPAKGFKAKDLPPISIRNEKRVLEKILFLAKTQYDAYPTSYEEDLKILEREDLTFNQRNSVLFRSGEKKILLFLITFCQQALPLFDMNFKAAKKAAAGFKDYEVVRDYLTNVVLYLIKKASNTNKQEEASNQPFSQEELQDGLDQMNLDQMKEEIVNQRKRCIILEKDLFKSHVECRKLDQQIKTLQEINTLNAKNRNNTSSAFTLPSEFKSTWDELVKELIIDALPDFLDKHEELVALVQELFISLREEVQVIQKTMIIDIGQRLHLLSDKVDQQTTEQIISYLEQKCQSIFQEYSLSIFSLSDQEIDTFLNLKYKPRCEAILQERDGALDEFEDNVSSKEFKGFVRVVLKLTLHMVLNDPPILLAMDPWEVKSKKEKQIEKFEFWMFNKNDYYCIDGFPKEGYPCIVVLPPPYRSGYVYQGIKPAVIVLNDASDELMEHVRVKQEEVLEKIKAKRALSLCSKEEEDGEGLNSNQEAAVSASVGLDEVEKQIINIVNQSIRSSSNSESNKNSNRINEDSLERTIEQLTEAIEKDTELQKSLMKAAASQSSSNKKHNFPSSTKKQQTDSPQSIQKQKQNFISPTKMSYAQLSELRKKKEAKQQQSEQSQKTLGNVSARSSLQNQLDQKSRQSQAQTQNNKENTSSSNNEEGSSSQNSLRKLQSQESFEVDDKSSSLKSPTQLKEKLSTVYNDYINVRNKQLSSSQYLNKQKLYGEQGKREDTILQSEQVSSARRRLSNNEAKFSQAQQPKHKYVADPTRNQLNTGSSLGSQYSHLNENMSQQKIHLNESQNFKNTIQSQIKQLAETMRGKLNQTNYKSNNVNQTQTAEYNSKSSASLTNKYQKTQHQQQTTRDTNALANSQLQHHANYNPNKYYEMPKKIQSDSQKRLAQPIMQTPIPQTNQSINASYSNGYNQSSIIAEMHFQNGMNSIKQDLQRKIHNYQSILKKTYADKVQKTQQSSSKMSQQPKSPFEYNKFKTIDNNHGTTTERVKGNSYRDEEDEDRLQNDKSSRNSYQNKIENLQSLKTAFFQKIHSLNVKLEQEKSQAQQQRLSSRSKSPLHQTNMPRQYNVKPSYQPQQQEKKQQTLAYQDEDSSSSDDYEDLNNRQTLDNHFKRDRQMTQSQHFNNAGANNMRDQQQYKRSKNVGGHDAKSGVNFKSLTRSEREEAEYIEEEYRRYNQGSNSQLGINQLSPKPCVTYRGGYGNMGSALRGGPLSSSNVYPSQSTVLTGNKYLRQ